MLFTEMYAFMRPGDIIIGSNQWEPYVETWFIISVERYRNESGHLEVHFWTYPTLHGKITDRHINASPHSFHEYWQEAKLVRAGAT